MRKKSKNKIMLIPWPPERQDQISSKKGMPRMTKEELGDTFHREIIGMFSDYESLIQEMANHFPIESVLLNISNPELPGFVRRLFEQRLKNGSVKNPEGGHHEF